MSGVIAARRSSGSRKAPIVLPATGDPFYGGYYAGTIDTTKGNIITADASQTGKRYALVVSPKTLESSSLAYKTSNDAALAAASTRWDGLTATAAMNSATYPAAQYCAGLTSPSDGGSAWYLPAMDELELIFRNLKATTENNNTSANSGSTFPGNAPWAGYNPSSDPNGTAYTTTVPARTTVTAFQSGGAQALGTQFTDVRYWSATEYSGSSGWVQIVSGTNTALQTSAGKTTAYYVRPVRRVLL